ncbi:putative dehydrodolichyl diphosphate synthase 2-like [Capsicum annuum]|nr:putative dehydrodolichyl diphosphate synthase 2-like [Capsicum annuum]
MSQASSSKTFKYDVFLSFRGEDTRRTFVSHLYNALEQKGIRTFKDDERPETGKSISDKLLKAIEEARFAVVIFSRSYASSRWCLEELAHIIKCKSELEQIVIPVFYDVSPSDVRHQNPPFAKSFSKHEKKCSDDMEKVQRWRDAFADAGKIIGYHLQNFKDEAECIKKLVDDIFPKSLQVISPFPESLVGMQSQVEKVTSLLDMESNDVRSIGIWGMGGIGKTEIASVLYQRYRHRFEADCFLGDVGTLYQRNGLTWLEQVVIRKLLGEKMTLTSEHEGMIILKNMLRWKKVLFILDDVNHREQLEYLVGGKEWFGKGSRIILTARDRHLLISHVGDNVYEVQLLSEDEALELFSRHAFKEKTPKEDFMELSRQVVEYAGGLPLALKVLGSSVYGRNKGLWRDIIDRLKEIPNDDVLGKLKIGLDGLKKDEMRIFLDIACLYNNRPVYYVEQILKSCGIHMVGISRLIEKSLLSVSSYEYNYFKMHNLIREMGENVLREEYRNSRIWLPKEVHDLFTGKLKLSNLKHLDLGGSLELTKTPNFGDMPILETLNLFYCKNLEEVHPSLGHCKMLTCLNLNGCVKLKKLPKFVAMESLETLLLDECTSLEEFPDICGDMPRLSKLVVGSPRIRSLPPSLSSAALNFMELRGCNKLATLPNSVFESQQLENLSIIRCSGLVEIPTSLGVQKKLFRLAIDGCENLKTLPSYIQMESLQLIDLTNCPKVDTFPEINGDMHCLECLTLSSTGIRELPSSIGNLSGLYDLNLNGCEDLVSLPNSLCNLMNLQYLHLDGCKKLEKLPENIGNLQELGILDATETAISQPPTSITKLGKLTDLRFSRSHVLQHVLHSSSFILPELSGLSSLTDLQLSNLNILGGLPEELGSLLFLDELNLSGSNISCLPKSIKQLLHLQCLDLQFCQNLNELPGEQLPPNLTDLYLDYHLFLKSIRDLVTKCLKLHVLSISWCRHEKSECGTVSMSQVNVLKSLQQLIRTCIQCDFHQRDFFLTSFPEVRSPELFHFQFINKYQISIDLNPSWYTDKFMGFTICYGDNTTYVSVVATLVCKSDPERKHSLKYVIKCWLKSSVMCFIYIPFETLWHAFGNKEGKNPNDYYLFEVSSDLRKELCWGIRLEGLCLGYEENALEVDQAAMNAQKEHNSQNVELIGVCGSPSRKMDDVSRKRKRKRNRKKKRKVKAFKLHDELLVLLNWVKVPHWLGNGLAVCLYRLEQSSPHELALGLSLVQVPYFTCYQSQVHPRLAFDPRTSWAQGVKRGC